MADSQKVNLLCAQEALNLLNCVTQSPYDPNKCTLLLDALRKCVVEKKVKKFTVEKNTKQEASPASNKA